MSQHQAQEDDADADEQEEEETEDIPALKQRIALYVVFSFVLSVRSTQQ